MGPSDDEIRRIIKDAENKMGDHHALIMSKKVMIAAFTAKNWRGWMINSNFGVQDASVDVSYRLRCGGISCAPFFLSLSPFDPGVATLNRTGHCR